MVAVSFSHGRALEQWSSTTFLCAGLLLVVYATLNGVAAFTETAYGTVENVVGPAGFVLGFVGLLGLYPTLVDRSPTLTRAGSVFAVLGAVGFSVLTLQGLARFAGVEPPAWLAISVLLGAIGMLPGFLAFGTVSLRIGVHSRTLGFLLMAPATIFAVMLSQALLFDHWGLFSETIMAWSAVVISGGQALAHLAIGYSLRTCLASTEREWPTGDATPG